MHNLLFEHRMLLAAICNRVDGELVVGPAGVLDAVAGAARLVPHLHRRALRRVLTRNTHYNLNLLIVYLHSILTVSKQTPVVSQSSVMPLPYAATILPP